MKKPHYFMEKSVVILLCMFAFLGIYACNTEIISANAASNVDLNYLMEKFPDGKYWNHMGMDHNNSDGYTDIPCNHSLVPSARGYIYVSNGTCNSFGSSIQCWGFVDKLAYECYGTMYHSLWPETTLDKLKPGDAIRFMYDMHSAFITGVDGEEVTYGECNGDYCDCKIRWNVKTTKSEIAKSLITVYSAPSELTVNLINRSSISAKEIKFGEKILINGYAVGGKGDYKYEFALQKPRGKNFTVFKKYSSWRFGSYYPWESGTYKLRINVKDKSGKIESKVFSFNVKADPLINNCKLKKTELLYGENAEFTFAAKGGTRGYEYEITSIKPCKQSVRFRSFAPGTSFSYFPWESGKYLVNVTVKDSSGNIKVKKLEFEVKTKPVVNNTVLSSTLINFGESVVFNFAADGGLEGYQYNILVKKPSNKKWLTLKNYSKASKFSYQPWEEGVYVFCISVKDRNEKTSEKILSLKVEAKLLINKSYVEEEISFEKGTVIRLNAEEGCKGYSYKISIYDLSEKKYVTLRDFSREDTYEFHPEKCGKFTLKIAVKDSAKHYVYDTYRVTVA